MSAWTQLDRQRLADAKRASKGDEVWVELLRTSKNMLSFYDELLADDAFTSEQDHYVNPLRKAIAKAEGGGA